MKRFKKILLVYDGRTGEESTLKRAVILAKSNRAELTLIDVIEELPRDLLILITSMHPLDLQQIAIDERQKTLDEVIQPIRREGIPICAKVLSGTRFIEVIREVLRNNHDLVIKTVAAKDGKKEVLFGSTAMSLMRKCPCPVWVIKPTPRLRFSRILAAVNPVPSDEAQNTLNRKIMDLASSLTQSEEGELHVVHAWDLYYDDILKNRAILSGHEVDRLVAAAENTHRAWLDELLRPYAPGISSNNVHLLRGHASKVISKIASREEIELIVMGTVCRTGVSGLLIGNTAEKVLQKVDCSVLTVKPEGFVSPVKVE